MRYLLTFLLGFACASPIGPMGLLCLRRVMMAGLRGSAAAIGGMALADTCWAFVAMWGVRWLSGWMLEYQRLLGGIAGTLFLAVGLHGLRNRRRVLADIDPTRALAGFAPNFAVVFFNPSTVLYFSGAFAVLGIGGGSSDLADAACVAVTVFLGVLTFWLLLGRAGAAARGALGSRQLIVINDAVSMLVAVIGLAMLLATLIHTPR